MSASSLKKFERLPPPDVHLTPTQLEVLKLIALDHSNKNIASILDVSVKTVEKHRGAAMAAVGLHSVTQVSHFCIAAGIVPCRWLGPWER